MIKRSFKYIFIPTLIVLLASFSFTIWALYNNFSTEQQDQLKTQTHLAAQGIEDESNAYLTGLETENIRITWIDKDGNVLYDNETEDVTNMENHKNREEVKEAFESGYGESSRYSDTLTQQSLYSAEKLDDGTVVRLSVSRDSILRLVMDMAKPIILILILAIFVCALLSASLARKIAKPLNELDLEHPLENEDYDELAPLLERIDEQQKQFEKQKAELDRTEQMRREFTANVSHELKTPLHSISGYAEIMANKMVKPEDIEPFSSKIYSEAQRMIQLVDDIINLSHLDEGAYNMTKEKVDYGLMVSQVVEDLKETAKKTRVVIQASCENITLEGVPKLLRSIAYNLCDNAIKYNQTGGTVTVDLSSDEVGRVILSVKDTGVGIPKEDQERIFERFYRVDKSHSKSVGGTGLGLSIVKHGAMIHDAELKVYSTLGKGSTISVIFPAYMNLSHQVD